MKREHLTQFFIAGFAYYEGSIVWDKLKIGKKLQLVAEPDNKYDPEAVAIYYKEHKLGFVPREENKIISKLLKIGFDGFEVRVQGVNPEEHPAAQVRVVVFLVQKEDGVAVAL